MPLTSFAEALITHRVALAADLSAGQGRPVRSCNAGRRPAYTTRAIAASSAAWCAAMRRASGSAEGVSIV